MNPPPLIVDVRDDLRHGREPFGRITAAVAGLAPRQELLLIAPFEPVPLFHVLASQGFRHETTRSPAGDWQVLFTRRGGRSTAKATFPGKLSTAAGDPEPSLSAMVELDARGLEPPQPMVRILEAITALPTGAGLRAHTDRRPVHLYPMLEQRGFAAQTEEQSDGSFITTICRA